MNPKPKHNEQTTTTQPTSSHYSYYCIFSNRYLSKHLKQPTMKLTAIQQLIDDLTSEIEDRKSVPATNKMYHTNTRIVQEILDFYVKPLLEKEKEQIIEAYGRAICMFYESEQPEEYYNETFNQNI